MDTPTPHPGEASSPALRPLWLSLAPLGIAAAVLACYWGALRTPFIFDDAGAVVNNRTIRELGSWAVLSPPADGSTATGRPLVNLSFALNHAVSGFSPWSYHVFNVLIHICSSLALWGMLRRLPGKASPLLPASVAFLTTLLWSLHPLQTETVVCVAQRTEGLLGLFLILCLYCSVRAAQGESPRLWSALAIACSFLGMASKEVMAVAPLLVLLLDRTFLAGSFASAWSRRRGLYAGLAASWLLLAWLLLGSGGSRGVSAGFGLGTSSWDYFLTQWGAIVHYLRLSFWPSPLALDYGTGLVTSAAAVWWQGLLLTVLGLASCWALLRRPALGFLGAAFFILLAPSSSVVPLVSQTVAEHRMYLPLAVVLLAATLFVRRYAPRLAVPVLILACLAAAIGTVLRVGDYRDEVSIWKANIAACPGNARGHNDLGAVYQAMGELQAAERCYEAALVLDPNYVSAHYNYGVMLLSGRRLEAALRHFSTAVSLAPAHCDALVNLANTLVALNRPADAVVHYEKALALGPAPDVHFNLGMAFVALRRGPEALAQFREALAGDAAMPEAWYQQGCLQLEVSRKGDAERSFIECIRLNSRHLDARRKLGMMYARSERLDLAGQQFLAITQLKPDDAEAWGNLGNVALFQGKVRDAIRNYETALRLDPSNRGLRQNLQVARESLQ